jgi:hypothetical protein
MAGRFLIIFSIFIDIVYKKLVIFAINLVIYHWKSNKFEMRSYLMEATGLGGSFHYADFPKIRVASAFQGFVFGLSGVGARDNGLADIDPAWLVFAESV